MKPITQKDISTAASLLGRLGGLRSAEGRMRNLTFEQRSALGKAAIAKRWEKYRREKAKAQAARAGAGGSGKPPPEGDPRHITRGRSVSKDTSRPGANRSKAGRETRGTKA